jgi:hypothetical protein
LELALRVRGNPNAHRRSRSAATSPLARKRRPARIQAGGKCREHHKARDLPLTSPFVRDASSGKRVRHSNGAGATWPHRSSHDDDLHPCAQPRGIGRAQSRGPALTSLAAAPPPPTHRRRTRAPRRPQWRESLVGVAVADARRAGAMFCVLHCERSQHNTPASRRGSQLTPSHNGAWLGGVAGHLALRCKHKYSLTRVRSVAAQPNWRWAATEVR